MTNSDTQKVLKLLQEGPFLLINTGMRPPQQSAAETELLNISTGMASWILSVL